MSEPWRERWQSDDGSVVLYLGDASEVLPTIEPIDLFFTSPPYNLGNTTGGGFPPLGHYRDGDALSRRGGGGKWQAASRPDGLAFGYGDYDDAMPHAEYVDWQRSILSLCWSRLSDGGAIFYNHKPRVLGGRLVTPFEYIHDLPIRQVVIWARAGGINFSPAFYVPTHEWIVIIAKESWRLRSKAASGAGDVWYVPQEENKLHPAPFPIDLPLRAIETTAAGVVCDPFMGSGTTIAAAVREGRRAIGIEKHPPFFGTAKRRIIEELGRFPLFPEPPAEQRELFTP